MKQGLHLGKAAAAVGDLRAEDRSNKQHILNSWKKKNQNL